ncbi:MAG: TIGR01212 family radical SAM protein, partial [Lachnospiraceae bacterium]|nr:TIGR01212 family radical SAM protein [Lachnospiraceae bacterium]
VERLRALYEEAISDEEVKILSIATRPDCLGKDVIDLLAEISAQIPVWIELGLQTSNRDSYVQINRCYENKVYTKAINDLRKAGIKHIITHIILGLPGENTETMLESVRFACESGTDGIKLQLLHILKDTKLADMYSRGEFEVFTLEDYTNVVAAALNIIPPDVVVHRLTGDGDKNKLIAPMWSADKKRVLNYMNKVLR